MSGSKGFTLSFAAIEGLELIDHVRCRRLRGAAGGSDLNFLFLGRGVHKDLRYEFAVAVLLGLGLEILTTLAGASFSISVHPTPIPVDAPDTVRDVLRFNTAQVFAHF